MKLFSNISIHKKLIIIQLITSLLVITISALTYLIIDYSLMKENKIKNIKSIENVIATNTIAPLLFDDVEAAHENLRELEVDSDIEHAWIFNNSSELFSSYNKNGLKVKKYPLKQKQFSNFEQDKHFYSFKVIVNENEKLGFLCIETNFNSLKDQLYQKIWYTALIITISFILAFLFASIFQNYISKPILNLVEIMQKVKKSNNFKLRSNIETKDEIGKLAEVFNNMIEQIEKNNEELSETNAQLESKVQERTQELLDKNEKLNEAKKQAEKSKLVKEQFLASMSHEIRTPLNAILGFQDLLKNTKLNKEQQEYVNSIDFAGRNLLVIINDILDISKIEAGKFIFEETAIQISKNLQSVIELVEHRAAEKNIKITTKIDSQIPKIVIGDDARLTQILLNLIGNAIKFTENGEVRVEIEVKEERNNIIYCNFYVIDSGIGISEENLQRIFDRFTQGTSAINRKYGGTGLGLTIVQQLIELQGGQISVTSELNKGSVFKFTLPFKLDIEAHLNNSEDGHVNIEYDITKLTILLVEDMVLNQNLIKKIMQKWKVKLDIANNGIQALAKLKTNHYDLILMDIQMPEMDGYEATKHIRSNENDDLKIIPIIALTAHASSSEAEKCINLGMNAYLAKPFNAEHLKRLIIQQTQLRLQKHEVNNNSKKHYNLNYLKEHAEGDFAFLKEMIEIFLKESPILIDELKESIASENYQKIKISSHSMKGIFLTLGIKKAGQLIREIELLADNKEKIEEIKKLCSEIESIYKDCKTLLEEEITQL